ncbi:unknown [Anaerotruncus sp. CAG:390]|nr:unknown [Anaerotruncus sp. CAG:390]
MLTALRSEDASDSILTPPLIIPFMYDTNSESPRKAEASNFLAYS